ncbi:unnamed protein product [Phytophthora fragariaefolia]|uniref:Unnamed protein product n=1 Tax=Phytophthora fragariaefolia TaxID=1490495 RepID=A0A9W6YQC0_9STRA|nr:unnamed protein product [Phytophthora fragariaefolia]
MLTLRYSTDGLFSSARAKKTTWHLDTGGAEAATPSTKTHALATSTLRYEPQTHSDDEFDRIAASPVVRTNQHEDAKVALDEAREKAVEEGLPKSLNGRLKRLIDRYFGCFRVELGDDPPVKGAPAPGPGYAGCATSEDEVASVPSSVRGVPGRSCTTVAGHWAGLDESQQPLGASPARRPQKDRRAANDG